MNKATRTKIQKYTMKTLTELFGPPRSDEHWIIPYGATGGTVSIWPIFDDTPWLACRLSNPIHVQPDGYKRPQAELDWPSQFTYPSGKHNMHSWKGMTFEEWELDFVGHLMSITAPGSAERAKVERLTFNVNQN